MKYILFSKTYINLQQYQVKPKNKTQETYKVPNIYEKKVKKEKL